jgi:hypothetical protein
VLSNLILETFSIADVLTRSLSSIDQKLTLAFMEGAIPKVENESTDDIDLKQVGKDSFYSDIIELLMPTKESLHEKLTPVFYQRRNA